MAKQPSYNERLAQQIVKRVGGAKNIINLSHCTTRLRFTLHTIPADAVGDIKSLPGVISVMHSGGMFQVVIGTEVDKLYDAVLCLVEKQSTPNLPSQFNGIIFSIIAIFSPLLWLLSASGILKGMIILFVSLGWLSIDTGTYRILHSSADSVFYYLPILLGYTSAKHFGSNPIFGIAIGGALVHPDITQYVDELFSMKIDHQSIPQEFFFGFPVEYLDYSSSVIPILFATWFNVKLENVVSQKLPDIYQSWVNPFLCLIVTIPLTFIVSGPSSTLLANYASSSLLLLYNSSPELAGFLVGSLWQVLVVFGIHWVFVPIIVTNMAIYGYAILPPLLIPAIFGQAGACLGIFLLNRSNRVGSSAGTAAITAMFGVTEPAIYGVTLPRKWPFIFGCITGGIGSCVVAAFHAKSYSFGMPGILALVQLIPPSGIDTTVIVTISAGLLSLGLALFLTYFFIPKFHSKDTAIEEECTDEASSYETNPKNSKVNGRLQVFSPLAGKVIPLSMVSDPTFASEIMGQGIAIRPESGTLYSPFNGQVSTIFKTHHAIGLVSEDGIEILIHIGIDTVKLCGEGFKLLVSIDQRVNVGQPLIQFDIELLTSKGFDIITPIIVSNSNDYLDIIFTSSNRVTQSQPLIIML